MKNSACPIAMKNKDVNYYMGLPYSMVVQHIRDEDGERYLSRVVELDGCHSHGATRQQALDNLREALEGYLEVKLEYGDPIPEPIDVNEYSGKFLVRIPKTLHQRLSIEADREGVSLNQYALFKLALPR